MRVILLIFISVISQVVNAQWQEITKSDLASIYDQVGTFYADNTSVYIGVTHSSFADPNTVVPVETMTGSYFKNGSDYALNILGTRVAQIGENKFTVLEEEKQIMLNDAAKELEIDPVERQQGMETFIAKVEKRKFGVYTEVKVFYSESPNIPYEYAFMQIGPSGFLTEMILFFADPVEWEDNEGNLQSAKPRLEIKYTLHPELIAVERQKLKAKQFVQNVNSKELVPSAQYSNYSIKDLRLKP